MGLGRIHFFRFFLFIFLSRIRTIYLVIRGNTHYGKKKFDLEGEEAETERITVFDHFRKAETASPRAATLTTLAVSFYRRLDS
jgi:hypothetical protein